MRVSHLAMCLALISFGDSIAASVDEDVNHRKTEILTTAQCATAPVIVFENGSRETFDTWDKVIASLKTDASMFAYNRPGYGKSDKTANLRDGRTIVDELRSRLRRQGMPPPYILVGHSLGGLYMQLFARAYPQEVKGLVLVDSIYPGAVKKTEDFPASTRLAKRLFFSQTVSQEIDQIYNTGNQILALPWNGDIPVERLINVPKSAGAIAVDFGVFNSGPALMAMIDSLYPNAKTTIVDSDHRIQVATPDAVVSAIRRVMPISRCAGAVK
jgi:pimeloyl-ACP methyl ester carboxylesterase